jgi:hypothetical protein
MTEQGRDPRFDDAESDVDQGTAWLFRSPDAPNPLTILATDWSSGMTRLGEAEWLNGTDRVGKKWSVLVGNVVLTKGLIEGLVEKWDEETKSFVVVETLGRVQRGEVVSIKYIGDVTGAKFIYPDFKISRKPPASSPDREAGGDPPPASAPDDDIRF